LFTLTVTLTTIEELADAMSVPTEY